MSAAPASGRPGVRRSRFRLLQYALIAVSVAFIALTLHESWADVQSFAWELDPGWLALSAAAFVLFYWLQAVGWWLLLRGFGLEAPLGWATTVWGQSILARYVPGNVFMFVGRAVLSHSRGLDLDRVSATMVYEQALQFCAALVTLGVLFPFWEYHPGLAAASLLGIPVLLVLLHPRVFRPLAGRLLRIARREPLLAVLPYPAVLGLLCYYLATWLLVGCGAWLLLSGVTQDAGAGLLPETILAYAFAYVAGMLAFVFPSGVGVREAVLAGSLGRELGSGVALAWAVLLRLWQVAIELAFVGVLTLVHRARRGAAESRAASDERREPAAPGPPEGT